MRQSHSLVVELRLDVEAEVESIKSATRYSPEDGGEIEITKVSYRGVDLSGVVGAHTSGQIRKMIGEENGR